MLIKQLMNGASHFCMSPDENGGGGAPPAAPAAPASNTPAPEGNPPAQGANTPAAPVTPKEPAVPATPTPGAVPTGGEQKPATPAAPADPAAWREAIAGDDKDLLAELSRYSTQKDMAAALIEAKKKIRSGQIRTPFPKEATPEQQTEWRKENGVPDTATPESYGLTDLKTADGKPLIPEHDSPYVDMALKTLHGINATPEMAKAVIALSYQVEQQRISDLMEADVTMAGVNDQKLRQEWGPEYQKNKNIVSSFLQGVPASIRDRLENGRLADGSPIFQDAESVKYFANLARELNPLGTVTQGTGLDKMDNVQSEIAAAEKRMRTDNAGWHKDHKAQARYRELLDFQMRMKGQTKRTA